MPGTPSVLLKARSVCDVGQAGTATVICDVRQAVNATMICDARQVVKAIMICDVRQAGKAVIIYDLIENNDLDILAITQTTRDKEIKRRSN